MTNWEGYAAIPEAGLLQCRVAACGDLGREVVASDNPTRRAYYYTTSVPVNAT